MAVLDAAVTRVLVEKSRLGLFEHPYAEEGALSLGSEEHRRLAAEAAVRSIVLLKNDGTLPLSGEGTTALVGPLADEQLAFFCSYSFPVHLIASLHTVDRATRYARTLREVLGERLPEGRLLYSKGCDIFVERPTRAPVSPAELGGQTPASPLSRDQSGFAAAVEAASRADRVIVAVGDLSGLFLTGTVGEGSDASSLRLPGVQQTAGGSAARHRQAGDRRAVERASLQSGRGLRQGRGRAGGLAARARRGPGPWSGSCSGRSTPAAGCRSPYPGAPGPCRTTTTTS